MNEILKNGSSLYFKSFYYLWIFFLPKIQNHLCLLVYDQDFSEFWICLELTKHNIWISIQGGRLIWKLFNAPGPQWDQIEEHFLWVECKWIRNMWIKFLLNLKGNLNIKEKCFANCFLASAKVRTLEKRVGDIYWIQMYPAFSSVVYKGHFDLWIKGNITKDLQVSYPIMLRFWFKISILLEFSLSHFLIAPCFVLTISQNRSEWHNYTHCNTKIL